MSKELIIGGSVVGTLILSLIAYSVYNSINNPKEATGITIHVSETDKEESSYKGKFGDKYRRFLIATSIDKSLSASLYNNRSWWYYKYSTIFSKEKPKKGKFAEVNDSIALKKVCDDAYKSNESDIVKTQNEPQNKFLEEEVWKYCSDGISPVRSIEDVSSENYSSNTYGETYKRDLIAFSNQENAWDCLLTELYAFNLLETLLFEHTSNKNSEFNQIFKKSSPFYRKLKEVCQSAYKTTVSQETDKYPEEDIFKFCSFKGKKEETTSPSSKVFV